MDAVDLFIGMEGTLGVIVEIGIVLSPKPQGVIGLCLFLSSEGQALNLVKAFRGEEEGAPVVPRPVAIEFFNHRTLDLLRKGRSEHAAFGNIPQLKEEYHTALYLEFHGKDQKVLEDEVMEVSSLLDYYNCNDDASWYADSKQNLALLKAFRHTPPESVNLAIDRYRRHCPQLTKLGTDMAVQADDLAWVLELYNADLKAAKLDYVIFGHIGDNHLHVNIIPKSMDEFDEGKKLYLRWAGEITARGGTVSAEHGIGKLKVDFLQLMQGDTVLAAMQEIKKVIDPHCLLGRGTLFKDDRF
jgi:D-lactate dehydrogenase (cytochrome)